MLGYVHDSTTLWRLWDADRKRVILASNVRFDEFAKGHKPANMRLDPFEFEMAAADASRQDDASRQVNSVAPSTQEDANVADVNATEASRQDDASSQVDADASRQDDAGRLVDADMLRRYDTVSFNLRKRPRAVAHRIWVEEESDSADPVSYRNAVEHPKLGQKWVEAVRQEL
jgi:hypothetical protein